MSVNVLKSIIGCAAIALISAAPTIAFAGAWTPKKGENYIKESFNYFETSSRFGPEGGFENFRNVNFNLYLEHGLKDDLTVFAQGAYVKTRNQDSGVTTFGSGVSDIDLGLRYRVIDGPIVVSVQGLFKAPYLYDKNADLPIGNGQEDFEGRVLIGAPLGDRAYGALEAGYRIRTEDPADEFRYIIELGTDLSERTYVRAKLDGTHAVGGVSPEDIANTPVVSSGNLNPQIPTRFNVGRLEYTAGYKINETLAAEIAGTTAVYGDNTLKGTNIQIGLVAKF